MNCFVWIDHTLANRTLIAGFGSAKVGAVGQGRYLAKFANGVHFWSENRDVETKSPIESWKWQMLTAIYDGHDLRLYRDGTQVGEQAVALSDDEPVVRLAPLDPWDHMRRFTGRIRQFTIWPVALPTDTLKVLRASGEADK